MIVDLTYSMEKSLKKSSVVHSIIDYCNDLIPRCRTEKCKCLNPDAFHERIAESRVRSEFYLRLTIYTIPIATASPFGNNLTQTALKSYLSPQSVGQQKLRVASIPEFRQLAPNEERRRFGAEFCNQV